jgi:hypothetical protein
MKNSTNITTIKAVVAVLFSLALIVTTATASSQSDRTFQSEEGGYRLHIPQGWVIDDNEIENALDSNHNIIAMLCLENEALPGIGGEYNCQAANTTDVIFISKWSDLQSRPEFQNSSSNIIPTTNDLVALWIQHLQNISSSQIKIENTTDIDEFTRIVNMTSEYFNVDVKSRIMFALSQDRNTGYSIINNIPSNILLVDYNQTQHSPAVQEVFNSFEIVEEE